MPSTPDTGTLDYRYGLNEGQSVTGLKNRKSVSYLEYRLLRKISGPKRDEVTGEWKS